MTDGNDAVTPTFGVSHDGEQGDYYPTEFWPKSGGLTKRELFAAMAMQGLVSDAESIVAAVKAAEEWKLTLPDAVAALAVEHADALVKALAKTEEPR